MGAVRPWPAAGLLFRLLFWTLLQAVPCRGPACGRSRPGSCGSRACCRGTRPDLLGRAGEGENVRDGGERLADDDAQPLLGVALSFMRRSSGLGLLHGRCDPGGAGSPPGRSAPCLPSTTDGGTSVRPARFAASQGRSPATTERLFGVQTIVSIPTWAN